MRLVQEMRQESRQIDKSSGLRLFSFSFHFDYEFLKGTSKNSKTHTHTFSCRSCAKEFQALAREVGGYTALFVCCHSTLGAHQPSWQVGNDLVVKRGRSLVRNKGHAYLVTFTVDVSDRMISNVSTHHLMTHCPWVRLTFQSAVPLG